MNRHADPWQKLVAAARQAPVRDDGAPFGFATRVAAQAMAMRDVSAPPAIERFALRGLIAAAALSLAAVAFGYSSMANESDDEALVGDAVGEVLLAMSTS